MEQYLSVSLFEYENYKQYCLDFIAAQPNGGRGLFRKLALHLRISPVVISQVLKGERQFSIEQALECGDFFGLQALEQKYFINLVQRERAGTHRLKKLYSEELKVLRTESLKIKNRIPEIQTLSESEKAQYYSSWYYSASRLLADLPSGITAELIANRFQIPFSKARQVIEFLTLKGLCQITDGTLRRTTLSTHLEAEHPLVTRHHQNWRLRGFQQMDSSREEELFFSGPMVLSEQTAHEIRRILVDTISQITQKTKNSQSETLRCLNIDWFIF